LLVTSLSTRCTFCGSGEEVEPGTWSNPGWVPIHFETPAGLADELIASGFERVVSEERGEPEDKPGGVIQTPTIYGLGRRSG
jgi:hypothetical protein